MTIDYRDVAVRILNTKNIWFTDDRQLLLCNIFTTVEARSPK
ncbi:hypothetical protein QT972_05220 [Microcoleus sp. herbarium7]